MLEEKDQTAKGPSENVSADDVFGAEMAENLSAADIFANSDELDNNALLGKGSKKSVLTVVLLSALIINVGLLTGGFVWYLYSQGQSAKIPVQRRQALVLQGDTEITVTGQDELPLVEPVAEEPIVFEGPASWKLAESFYNNQKYEIAYQAYQKLQENLTTNIASDAYLSDLLELKMAICLSRLDDKDMGGHFSVALESRSPAVKALANYHLAFIYFKAGKFMQARQSIYETLALSNCFSEYVNPVFETDCYFIACESITKYVLEINNRKIDLPGKGWTGNMKLHSILPDDQAELRHILESGVAELADGAVIPSIKKSERINTGLIYSATAISAPFKEAIDKLASESGKNIVWKQGKETALNKAVTMYLPNTTVELIAEMSAASAGLIARFDGDDIVIYNPQIYDSLDDQKDLLTKEAIVLWRRFLMRYRGDHRSANASFARAMMLDCAGETDSAITHYSRTANRFTHSSLAPYSLLNSSNLRIILRDYSGARQDLTQLVMQYAASGITNQAYLNLARATMSSGLYKEAARSFGRLYNTNISQSLRAQAARGAGMCYYELKDYKSADDWLLKCVGFENQLGQSEIDFGQVYFIFGKVKAKLGQFDQAAAALKNSLRTNLPTQEHIRILLELSDAQVSQGEFVDALDTIENIDTTHLSQELIVDVLIAKSYILRNIELPENAIAILRHRLAYIADVKLRAKLSLEMARCYLQNDDYQAARAELVDTLKDLKPGEVANNVNFALLEITLELREYGRTIENCHQLLKTLPEPEMVSKIYEVLGQAYAAQENYEMSAMAFAGKVNY